MLFFFFFLLPSSLLSKKIAIIGSGAGGSSLAYFIHKEIGSADVAEIDIYERENQIGGRVQHVEIRNKVVEIGAAIFIPENYLIVNISSEFNVSFSPAFRKSLLSSSYDTFGIWDGVEFLFKSSSYSVWTNLKFIWRYSFNFMSIFDITKKYLSKWISLMYEDYATFSSVEDMISQLDFEEQIQKSANLYFKQQGATESFIREFIAGISRSNYAQNTNEIHVVGALICLVAATSSNLYAFDEGNRKLFEKMIKSSKARIMLKDPVKNITKVGDKYLLKSHKGSNIEYDYVVIASPLVNIIVFSY
jgi:prenylcysteine oxidase/farnesylcysteine lyase